MYPDERPPSAKEILRTPLARWFRHPAYPALADTKLYGRAGDAMALPPETKLALIEAFLALPSDERLTNAEYSRFRCILPFVRWNLADGGIVLATRGYNPILRRNATGLVEFCTPHWVAGIVAEEHLFTSHEHPTEFAAVVAELQDELRAWVRGLPKTE